MKTFIRKAGKVSGATLLATVLLFSACKKDKEVSVGTQAGNAMCDCASKQGEELLACSLGVIAKYANDMDMTTGQFKDPAVQADFAAAAAKCSLSSMNLNEE
ncbi:MAG: hypothetical protein LBV26_05400 [Bacteroidales bacterium]|jgi:hypothetical protein|nr:hypothetical protein [Bacteroidales bacterium]